MEIECEGKKERDRNKERDQYRNSRISRYKSFTIESEREEEIKETLFKFKPKILKHSWFRSGFTEYGASENWK